MLIDMTPSYIDILVILFESAKLLSEAEYTIWLLCILTGIDHLGIPCGF